jgi:hypothetical protein
LQIGAKSGSQIEIGGTADTPANYVLSALVALNISAAARMKVLPGLGKLSKRISAWAGVTFAHIYCTCRFFT